MKKTVLSLLLAGACLLSAFSGSCVSRPQAAQEATSPELYNVSFYSDGKCFFSEEVTAGETPSEIPEKDDSRHSILYWTDENGAFADAAGTPVSGDVSYYAWAVPALSTHPGAYMDLSGAAGTEPSANQGELLAQPDAEVTRGEAAQFLYNLLEDPSPDAADAGYTDLDSSDACAAAVAAMSSLEILHGYPDGSFRPDQSITRAEFIAAVSKFTPPVQSAGTDFSDVPAVYWAADAIASAVKAGWLSGYPDGKFYPDSPLTRAEAAAILNRVLDFPQDGFAVRTACPEDPFADLSSAHWAYNDLVLADYRNELLSVIMGDAAGQTPGLLTLEQGLCHVNADTLRLDYYEIGFQTIDGGLYHCSQAGYFLDVDDMGQVWLDDHLYYAQGDGSFLTNDDVGYLHFGEDGRYTSGSEVIDSAVDSILSGLDGTLYGVYSYVRDETSYYNWNDAYVRGSHGWETHCGEVVFKSHKGHCFYWASEFLYLARGLGYQAYAVIGGGGTQNKMHCWVMIKSGGSWYICDPELEWTFRNGYYDGVKQYRDMYMQPLNASQILYVFPDGTYSYPSYWNSSNSVAEESDDTFIVVPETSPSPSPSGEPSGDPTPSPSNTASASPGASDSPSGTNTPAPSGSPTPVSPTEAPATEPPATEAPATEAPATEAPATEAPSP